jgi:TonB family protein
MLDRAATEAVQRYEFLPIRQGDMVVVAWVEIPIRFQLR